MHLLYKRVVKLSAHHLCVHLTSGHVQAEPAGTCCFCVCFILKCEPIKSYNWAALTRWARSRSPNYIYWPTAYSSGGSSGASWFSQRGRGWWYVLALPARQGAAVRPIASPSVSQRDREQFSQCGREQRYVPLRLPARQGAVLPARQGAVVHVGSPSAAGSSGMSLILILLFVSVVVF